MSVRAFVMFFVTLLLIRLGGMRIFGKKSAFDTIIVIMMGAVLARVIAGASPFGGTVVATGVMVAIKQVPGLDDTGKAYMETNGRIGFIIKRRTSNNIVHFFTQFLC